MDRIGRNLRASRLTGGVAPRLPSGSEAAAIEVGRGEIEVRYTTGWKEEISAGRYELKDPNDNTVSIQNIEVESFGVAEVTVAEGLAPDDIVVIAGAQALRPGQKVRLSAREM